MKTFVRHSHHLKTPQKLETLVYSSALFEESISKAVDRYPDVKTLKKLHSRIIVDQNLRSNPSLGIKLMRAYAVGGETRITRHVFDEIPEKNVVFFNVMIRSYVNNHLYDEGLLVFGSMSGHGISPDNYTYPCVLKACSSSRNVCIGLQIHGSVIKVGLDLNLFVGNGLIAMYGKCDMLMEARRVLDEMPRSDVVSWNSMVAGFAQNARFDDALQACREMASMKLNPDAGTMASLLPAVTDTSRENVSYIENMFTSLAHKNLISWNVMIAVYVNNSMPGKAVDLFLQMEDRHVAPDPITIATVLSACGDLSALSLGKRLHLLVERKSYTPNLLLENSLMDMYAKCGSLGEARDVFEAMKIRDIVSWTSLISAYGRSGHGGDAVKLFEKMLGSGFSPDSVVFVSVLSACSHSGLLDEGRRFFRLMVEEFKIAPRIEHFSCFVDLLGRAGRVDEAHGFVITMPIEPNERVWGALLSACRVYNDMKVGVIAADKLFQMNPEQAGYYVLLSNIYAKAERWSDVASVRSAMRKRGIKKTPGVSNVELGGKIHTFLAGDQSHRQSERIYEKFSVLASKMKELGYVAETDSALHDVEEEDKERHLAVHSEKLAVAFAIINSEPHAPIRITKNLRVCGDCHTAMKLISRIERREIVVRDAHRFHRFADGVCSCRDYW